MPSLKPTAMISSYPDILTETASASGSAGKEGAGLSSKVENVTMTQA